MSEGTVATKSSKEKKRTGESSKKHKTKRRGIDIDSLPAVSKTTLHSPDQERRPKRKLYPPPTAIGVRGKRPRGLALLSDGAQTTEVKKGNDEEEENAKNEEQPKKDVKTKKGEKEVGAQVLKPADVRAISKWRAEFRLTEDALEQNSPHPTENEQTSAKDTQIEQPRGQDTAENTAKDSAKVVIDLSQESDEEPSEPPLTQINVESFSSGPLFGGGTRRGKKMTLSTRKTPPVAPPADDGGTSQLDVTIPFMDLQFVKETKKHSSPVGEEVTEPEKEAKEPPPDAGDSGEDENTTADKKGKNKRSQEGTKAEENEVKGKEERNSGTKGQEEKGAVKQQPTQPQGDQSISVREDIVVDWHSKPSKNKTKDGHPPDNALVPKGSNTTSTSCTKPKPIGGSSAKNKVLARMHEQRNQKAVNGGTQQKDAREKDNVVELKVQDTTTPSATRKEEKENEEKDENQGAGERVPESKAVPDKTAADASVSNTGEKEDAAVIEAATTKDLEDDANDLAGEDVSEWLRSFGEITKEGLGEGSPRGSQTTALTPVEEEEAVSRDVGGVTTETAVAPSEVNQPRPKASEDRGRGEGVVKRDKGKEKVKDPDEDENTMIEESLPQQHDDDEETELPATQRCVVGRPSISVVDADAETEMPLDYSPEPSQRSQGIRIISCPICSKSIAHMAPEDREEHVNSCMDEKKGSQELKEKGASDSQDFQEKYLCSICSKDITSYNQTRRQQHTERCLEEHQAALTPSPPQNPNIEYGNNSIDGVKFYCPLCGVDRSNTTLASRIKHLKDCAKKHGVNDVTSFRNHKQFMASLNNAKAKAAPATTTTTATTTANNAKKKKKVVKRKKREPKQPKPPRPVVKLFPEGETVTPSQIRSALSRFRYNAKATTTTTTSTKQKAKKDEEEDEDFDLSSDSDMCSGEREEVQLAMALSASLHESPLPDSPAPIKPNISPPKEANSKSRREQLKLAAKKLFEAEDNLEISPTPKFAESTLAKQRRHSKGLSMWGLSASKVGAFDSVYINTTDVIPAKERKQLEEKGRSLDPIEDLAARLLVSPDKEKAAKEARFRREFDVDEDLCSMMSVDEDLCSMMSLADELEKKEEELNKGDKKEEENEATSASTEISSRDDLQKGEEEKDQSKETRDTTRKEEEVEKEEATATLEGSDVDSEPEGTITGGFFLESSEENLLPATRTEEEGTKEEGEEELDTTIPLNEKEAGATTPSKEDDRLTSRHLELDIEKEMAEIHRRKKEEGGCRVAMLLGKDKQKSLYDGDVDSKLQQQQDPPHPQRDMRAVRAAKRTKKRAIESSRKTTTTPRGLINNKRRRKSDTPDDNQFTDRVQSVLESYRCACEETKNLMEKRIREIKDAYYAEIGRITLEKDRMLQELQQQFDVPSMMPFLMGMTMAVPSKKETTEADPKKKRKNKRGDGGESNPIATSPLYRKATIYSPAVHGGPLDESCERARRYPLIFTEEREGDEDEGELSKPSSAKPSKQKEAAPRPKKNKKRKNEGEEEEEEEHGREEGTKALAEVAREEEEEETREEGTVLEITSSPLELDSQEDVNKKTPKSSNNIAHIYIEDDEPPRPTRPASLSPSPVFPSNATCSPSFSPSPLSSPSGNLGYDRWYAEMDNLGDDDVNPPHTSVLTQQSPTTATTTTTTTRRDNEEEEEDEDGDTSQVSNSVNLIQGGILPRFLLTPPSPPTSRTTTTITTTKATRANQHRKRKKKTSEVDDYNSNNTPPSTCATNTSFLEVLESPIHSLHRPFQQRDIPSPTPSSPTLSAVYPPGPANPRTPSPPPNRATTLSLGTTPKPDYGTMSVWLLKKTLANYGVRGGSKQWMVEKLTEIWEATHLPEKARPLESPSIIDRVSVFKKKAASQEADPEAERKRKELKEQMTKWIKGNAYYYSLILQYEAVQLGELQTELKTAGIKCSRKVLAEYLESKGVAFNQPAKVG